MGTVAISRPTRTQKLRLLSSTRTQESVDLQKLLDWLGYVRAGTHHWHQEALTLESIDPLVSEVRVFVLQLLTQCEDILHTSLPADLASAVANVAHPCPEL